MLPQAFRNDSPMFDNIYNLDTVPIATVQVRFDDDVRMMDVSRDQSDGRRGLITFLILQMLSSHVLSILA